MWVLSVEFILCPRHHACILPWFITFSYCKVAEVLKRLNETLVPRSPAQMLAPLPLNLQVSIPGEHRVVITYRKSSKLLVCLLIQQA